ncbi:MAG: hypothetical protein A2Y25_04220 [Candidatus Melainabacteria bacterium GWF2_37_15]|nr:MAG: hypothetical protein A2Y25_04220 [Candidatus Melainabacteria bacterium GWF2_37_15]
MHKKTVLKIKMRLLELNISQKQIAQELGITEGAVSHLVNRKSTSKRFDEWVKNRLGIDINKESE